MCPHSPSGLCVHIRQITPAHVTYITCTTGNVELKNIFIAELWMIISHTSHNNLFYAKLQLLHLKFCRNILCNYIIPHNMLVVLSPVYYLQTSFNSHKCRITFFADEFITFIK